jgi:uncharacterized protein
MTSRAAFVVRVHDLDVGGRNVQFELTPAWLRGALEGAEIQPTATTGVLDAHLIQTGNEVLVQGQIDVELTIPCARCLGPVLLRPHIELSLLLFPAASAGAERARRPGTRGKVSEDATEFEAEDADTDTYDGEEVVLDRYVREAILLESPIFPLCSEACEGIRAALQSAPASGQSVTDPRLLPLLELAKRRSMKE